MTARAIPSRPFAVPTAARPARQHQIPDALRDAIWVRCGGICELCKEALRGGFDPHHRKLRKQGGEDSVTNVLALHRHCHRRVHSNPAWSYDTGFLVKSTEQPGRKQLALHCARWVRLTRQGTYVEAAA